MFVDQMELSTVEVCLDGSLPALAACKPFKPNTTSITVRKRAKWVRNYASITDWNRD